MISIMFVGTVLECRWLLTGGFFQAEKLMKQIGVQNVKLSEYEMSIAAHLVDPLTMQVRELLQYTIV